MLSSIVGKNELDSIPHSKGTRRKKTREDLRLTDLLPATIVELLSAYQY